MKEQGKTESLIRRYRGIGLLFLCLVMYTVGSLNLQMRAVETGAPGKAEQREERKKEKNDPEKMVRVEMETSSDIEIMSLLENLKVSHKKIQIRVKNAGTGENSWYLEICE